MQPVMIGTRSPGYDTLDKVMTRLEKIMNVMLAMENIVVNVRWKKMFIESVTCQFFMSFIVFFTYGERLDKVSKVG